MPSITDESSEPAEYSLVIVGTIIQLINLIRAIITCYSRPHPFNYALIILMIPMFGVFISLAIQTRTKNTFSQNQQAVSILFMDLCCKRL